MQQQGPLNLDVFVAPVESARLRRELEGIFPEMPQQSQQQVFAVVTMQETSFDLVSRSPGAEEEKNRFCDRFFRWARVVALSARSEGCWSDFPDPATGYPVLGQRGGLMHNELDCVQTVLKFPVNQAGGCCVLEHPRWGTRCYPASLFVVGPDRSVVDRAVERANSTDLGTGKPFVPESRTSETGLFIALPRGLWAPFNDVREEYFEDLRLGPHVSVVDPFVLKSQLDRAWLILSDELQKFPSFKVCLRKFDVLVHGASCTVFAVPEDDPPGSIQSLSSLLLKLIPCCDHLVQRGNGQLKAHISLAKCKSERRARELVAQLSARLNVVEFSVKELLLLVRDSELGRGHPFRLHASIRLGGIGVPSFGFGSVEWTSCTQVVVSGLTKAVEEAQKAGRRIDMLKKRTKPFVALISFDDVDQAAKFVASFNSNQVKLRRDVMYP